MTQENREEGARERILNAAIDIIERDGIEAATARAIAAVARVNLAAINYYYRSKDALMEAALAASWEHALVDLRVFLKQEPWNPRAGMEALAMYLSEGAEKFPTVTRLHFQTASKSSGAGVSAGSGRKGTAFWTFVEECAEKVSSSMGISLDWVLLQRTEAFFAAIICPAVAPGFGTSNREILPEAKVRLLVDDYLRTIAVR
jgi:AcrR family transcriptional regulator